MTIADNVIINPNLTTESFSLEIERLVKNYNLDYIDAITHFCEKNNVEIETVASIVKSNLRIKSRIQSEAENLNYLPKSAKLKF